MNLLALETSTLACSVALQAGDEISSRHVLEARQHTQLLVPMLEELLGEAGIQPGDLDAVILGNGPGSFIGMRIAASVAQGLCFGTGAALVPVSSLAAVAAEALSHEGCTRVLVAQDARMQEVYLEGYAQDTEGLPEVVLPVRLQPVGEIAGLTGKYCAAGFGWRHYPRLWTDNEHQLTRLQDIDYPHARQLLHLGRARWQQGGQVAPELLEPAYVRNKVAEKPDKRSAS